MKRPILGVAVLGVLTRVGVCQTMTTLSSPLGTGWNAVSMDDCSTTWESTVQVTNNAAGVVPHRVVEVATGLNYVDPADPARQWQRSLDLIELANNGFAAAVHGQTRVYFNPNLTTDAAITIITKSNRVFQVRVVDVRFYDPSTGKAQVLATPNPAAVPELHPPNQVVYRSAFNSDVFQADLRYTYTKAGLESDVVITRQPKSSPSNYGLNPDTARLQVRHQWLVPAAPLTAERAAPAENGTGLTDEQIDFGDLWFPAGRAFAWDGSQLADTNVPAQISLASIAGGADQVSVGKHYSQTNNLGILTESVTWSNIAPQLAQLPLMADARRPARQTEVAALKPSDSPLTQIGSAKRRFMPTTAAYRSHGVIIDWIVVSGSGDYTFNTYVPGSGNTYWLTGSGGYFAGTVTFQPGCILKYASTASLIMYGGIVCNGTPGLPSILTSQDDGFYGENISQNSPPRLEGTALWIYYISTNVTISGMNVRYANVAAEFDANGCNSATHTVVNSAVFSCNTGINIYNPNVVIQSSICAHVPTTTACLQECCSLTGAFTDVSSATDPNGLCYLTTSFNGLSSAQTIPSESSKNPDTMGASGPSHYIEVINGAVAVYDKNSGQQLSPPTSMQSFFSVTVPSGQYAGTYPKGVMTDPRVVYDQSSQRWIACAIDTAGGPTQVLLAVSTGPNPVGAGGSTWVSANWTKYMVPMDPSGVLLDYDRLGVDGNGIYIISTVENGERIAALPKSPFLNGTAQTVQDQFIFNLPGLGGLYPIKVFPAVNFDPVAQTDPVWLVGDYQNTLYYDYLEWANGFTTAPVIQLGSWGSLPITPSFADLSFGQSMTAPQKGGPQMIAPYSGSSAGIATVRKLAATQYMWISHMIGVNSAGNNDNGQADRLAVEWLQIQTTPTVRIVASSRIFDQAVNPRFYYLPSVGVNTNGDSVLGFSTSSVNDYVGAFYTRRSGAGAWLNAPIPYRGGQQYTQVTPDQYFRWGDYSSTTLDPDGLTVWTIQEYAIQGDFWGTAIAAIRPFTGGSTSN